MTTLKIKAQRLDIEFDKGGTFDPIFYVFDSDGLAVDLSSHKAVMQIWDAYDAPEPLFNLTTENNGITITEPTTVVVKAGKTFNGVLLKKDVEILNAMGIQPHIAADDTSIITQSRLVYSVDLIEPDGRVIKHLRGTIKLGLDGTV